MREHPAEFAVTFRRMGVSVGQVGGDVSWREAVDLTMGALGDTSTPLFAAFKGWAFPASFPELVQISAAAGDQRHADRLMPWVLGEQAREREARAVSVSDVEAGRALLRRYSAMRDLDGFET